MKTISQPCQGLAPASTGASALASASHPRCRRPVGSCAIARAASMPFMPGMRMSRKTMSGCSRRVLLDRLGTVLRLGDDLELGPDLAQAGAELVAQQPLVVGDEWRWSWHGWSPSRDRHHAVSGVVTRLGRNAQPQQPQHQQQRRGDDHRASPAWCRWPPRMPIAGEASASTRMSATTISAATRRGARTDRRSAASPAIRRGWRGRRCRRPC